jgi:hypothetical protein
MPASPKPLRTQNATPYSSKNSVIFPQIVPYHKTIGSFQNDYKISLKFN